MPCPGDARQIVYRWMAQTKRRGYRLPGDLAQLTTRAHVSSQRLYQLIVSLDPTFLPQYPLHPRLQDNFYDRFWAHVQQTTPTMCWLWRTRARGRGIAPVSAYGSFQYRTPSGDIIGTVAHRLAYELWYAAPIPMGKIVMHLCDTPRCVNPSHLRIGDATDNYNDAWLKGRVPESPQYLGEKSHAHRSVTTRQKAQ